MSGKSRKLSERNKEGAGFRDRPKWSEPARQKGRPGAERKTREVWTNVTPTIEWQL
jgi:hypothetical protein